MFYTIFPYISILSFLLVGKVYLTHSSTWGQSCVHPWHAVQKLLTIFQQKALPKLIFVSTARLKFLANDFFKLLLLWTTRPWTSAITFCSSAIWVPSTHPRQLPFFYTLISKGLAHLWVNSSRENHFFLNQCYDWVCYPESQRYPSRSYAWNNIGFLTFHQYMKAK